jgi:hypothetical protein
MFNPRIAIADHSISVAASPEAVWRKLVDWTTWQNWDRGLDLARFDGQLEAGAIGELKLKDGLQVKLRVTECRPGDSYTSEFSLFGTTFIFGHVMSPNADRTVQLRFTADAQGITAFLIGNIAKAKIERGLPEWMSNLKRAIET